MHLQKKKLYLLQLVWFTAIFPEQPANYLLQLVLYKYLGAVGTGYSTHYSLMRNDKFEMWHYRVKQPYIFLW